MSKSALAILAFVAACLFFALDLFGQSLGDVRLLAAGLFCTALGLLIEALP